MPSSVPTPSIAEAPALVAKRSPVQVMAWGNGIRSHLVVLDNTFEIRPTEKGQQHEFRYSDLRNVAIRPYGAEWMFYLFFKNGSTRSIQFVNDEHEQFVNAKTEIEHRLS